jgi:hypothetical protein
MKRGRIVLASVLVVVVAAAFTLAYAASKAPDKPITIESKDVIKERKKAPVVFDHAKHKEAKCDRVTTCTKTARTSSKRATRSRSAARATSWKTRTSRSNWKRHFISNARTATRN